MKKLILMTSALTLMGGAAVAEITVAAEASLTYGNWDGAPAAGFGYNTEVTFTMEETTASGLTYGADATLDIDAGTMSDGTLWISGGFGKFSFGIDAFDAVTSSAGNDSGDIEYEYSSGALTATVTVEAALGNEITDGDATTNDWNVAVDYDGGSWTLGLNTDSTNLTEVSASVDVGNFTIGGAADTNNAWDVWASTTFGAIDAKLTYDSAAVAGIELGGSAGSVDWELTYDTTGATTASVGTSFGDMSVDLAYDSTNAGGTGDDAMTVLTMEYAAGDNLTLGLKLNDVNEYEASVTAGFTF